MIIFVPPDRSIRMSKKVILAAVLLVVALVYVTRR
jgi:hypothetical protein